MLFEKMNTISKFLGKTIKKMKERTEELRWQLKCGTSPQKLPTAEGQKEYISTTRWQKISK